MNINPAALRRRMLHTRIMEWTNDDALELIEQYRSKTELWNRSDPKYKDKLCRFRAWSEIADRFGCSKAEVERKMNVLLTQYRREKHKMLMKLYQGIQPSPSKWYAFRRFDFMEITYDTHTHTATDDINSVSNITRGCGPGVRGGRGGRGPSPGGTSSNIIVNTTSSSSSSTNNGITTNGHHHQHHHHNHHAAAAVAAAAALNGLTAPGYGSASAASTTPTSSHHRRMKTKEMKYFGSVGPPCHTLKSHCATGSSSRSSSVRKYHDDSITDIDLRSITSQVLMGINLPILLANSQPLEPWNPVNQFSPPPINDRNQQLRASLPLPFPTPTDLNTSGTNSLVGTAAGNGGTRNLFGGSSNSSPHKPMDTTENEDNNKAQENNDNGTGTPSMLNETSVTPNEGRLSTGSNGTPGGHSDAGAVGSGGVGGANEDSGGGGGVAGGSGGNSGTDAGSSPIPNTNNFEAHKQRQIIAGGAIASGSRDQGDLDIKQELLENYFHAPQPPVPPDSRPSYSPNDDKRRGPERPDEFAQDLRVRAAAAAAQGIDFTRFALQPGLRCSTDSMDDKFSPMNIRQLSAAASTANQTTGHMRMRDSALSADSMSEDNNSMMSGPRRSVSTIGNPTGIIGIPEPGPSPLVLAPAAARFTETLNMDDYEHVGSNVTNKLRTMDRTQCIIAEKLIGEVLYYGQFNELKRHSRIQLD